MRHAVRDWNGHPVALFRFSTAGWRLKPHDLFNGWSLVMREQNLSPLVDQSRFLFLSWIHIPNPRSRVVVIIRRKSS